MAEAVERLGGPEVAVANAGIGAQMTLVDGDPKVWDATIDVNLNGTYNLIRAAGPHGGTCCSPTSSLAAGIHFAADGGLLRVQGGGGVAGDSLRLELALGRTGGRCQYAELDTDMTSRGFATKAAARMPIAATGASPSRRLGRRSTPSSADLPPLAAGRVAPLVGAVLPISMLAQRASSRSSASAPGARHSARSGAASAHDRAAGARARSMRSGAAMAALLAVLVAAAPAQAERIAENLRQPPPTASCSMRPMIGNRFNGAPR